MPQDFASPACNPGFLDTLTWDKRRAAALGLQAMGDGRFGPLVAGVAAGYPESAQALDRLIRRASRPPLTLLPASVCAHPRYGLFLVGILEDGQHLFVAVTAGASAPPRAFGLPLGTGQFSAAVAVWPCASSRWASPRCARSLRRSPPPIGRPSRRGPASGSAAAWACWMCRRPWRP